MTFVYGVMIAILLLLAALVWAWRQDMADEARALRRALEVERAQTESYLSLARMCSQDARAQRANAESAYRAIEVQAARITALQQALRTRELTLITDLPTMKSPNGEIISMN